MIIITKYCFVIAEQIHYMNLSEDKEECRKKGKWTERPKWNLTVRYVPTPNPNSRRDVEECSVSFYDKKEAMHIFSEVVRQYREQNPDALYLDTVINSKLLGGDDS